ncbi:MAG: 50S ribosomal protein L35ae [Promethearchaeota archaeon]
MGIFLNYRQSKSVVHHKHSILKFPEIDTRNKAYSLIGKTVVWESVTGKQLKGKITRVHGKGGSVIAHFKKSGLPGQAIGHEVFIL